MSDYQHAGVQPGLRIAIQGGDDFRAGDLTVPSGGVIERATRSHVVRVQPDADDDVFVSDDGRITVVVHGELLNDLARPARFVHDHYYGDPDTLARSLNGAFVVLIVDEGRDFIYVITDRVNGRRLFARSEEGANLFSTLPADFSSASDGIDVTAVAWYLANGTIHNGRTVYTDVHVVERASVISFNQAGYLARQYWVIDFDSAPSSSSLPEFQAALTQLVAQAVRRCVQDDPDVFLSLSGGYDASAIGGALRFDLDYHGVTCFSYAMGEALPGTDEHRAQEMARIMGYHHRLVQSYEGDFIQHLRLNGEFSRAFANPCDEVSAYDTIARSFDQHGNPVFFTGSEWFGDDCMDWAPLRLSRPADVLQSAGMYDFSRVRWVQQMLPDAVFHEMRSGLKNDYDEVWERCPFKENLYDAKDYVYLDQRLVHHNMPWWQCYPGRFAPVRNPLLDRDVLEFMTTVPTTLRRDKTLWRQTASQAYRQLFRLPRTRRGSYEFDLEREFVRHRSAVVEMIDSSSSPLDELLPPDIALKMLEVVCGNKGAELSAKTHVINFAKRSVPSRLKRRIRSFWPPSALVPEQAPAIVLRRLLVLREALRIQVQDGVRPAEIFDRG